MHRVKIHVDNVSCSCGFFHKTITSSETRRLGYEHARLNTPSIVEKDIPYRDICLEHNVEACTDACINGDGKETDADENWHHVKCPNHNEKCCDFTTHKPFPDSIEESLRIAKQHSYFSIRSLM